MKTVLLFVLYSLAVPTLHAQVYMTLTDQSPAAMYNYRGYLSDKSRNVHNNLSVSRMNGNVQYRYDISEFEVNQVPIKVSMSYNQNASWTSFLRYNWACTTDDGATWTKKTMNRPVWILGVNGFAVQALTKSPRYIARPDLREESAKLGNGDPQTLFTDADLVWVLDGYDYCNRMQSMDALVRDDLDNTPWNDTQRATDVIRLLREDGSILELYRSDYFSNQQEAAGATNSEEHIYSGVFVPAEPNSMAYAIVTTEPNYLPDNVATVVSMAINANVRNLSDAQKKYVLPRKVEYFPGDGTSYVFREDIAPYGVEPYTNDLDGDGSVDTQYPAPECKGPVLIGWRDASPTIFYLVAIRYNKTDLVTFLYGDEGNKVTEIAQVDGSNGVLINRGRDVLLGFDNHTLHWGANSLTINACGRRHTFEFADGMYSGSAPEWARNAKMIPLSWLNSTFNAQSEYWNWTGLVTKITDPIGRETNFAYTDYDRVFLQSYFPYYTKATGTPDPSQPYSSDTELQLSVKTLTEVKEPASRYTLDYKMDVTFEQNTLDSRPGAELIIDDINFTIEVGANFRPVVYPEYNTIANTLKKYDRADIAASDDGSSPLLWTENYDIPLKANNGGTGSLEWVSTVDHVDARTNRTLTSKTVTTRFEIPNSYRWEPASSANYSVTKEQTIADGVTETILRVYPSEQDGFGIHGNMQLPEYELVTVNNGLIDIERTKTVFEYEFETETLIPYASPSTGRTESFEAVYGKPLHVRRSTLNIKEGTNWVGQLLTIDTLLNLDRVEYLARHYAPINKIATWRKFRECAIDSNWDFKDWEQRYYNSKLEDSWIVFGDSTTTDDDMTTSTEETAPHFQLVQSSTIYDITQQSALQSWTKYTYDLEPKVVNPFNEIDPDIPNPSFGKKVSTTVYGEDLKAPIVSQLKYSLTTGFQNGFKSLPTTITDTYGAEQYQWFNGESVDTWVTTEHTVDATKVLNKILQPGESISEKHETATINLASNGSMLWEKPTQSERTVRRYTLENSIPQLTSIGLRTATAYTPFGENMYSVDMNGFLSEYKYDNIGRLVMAWLPHDFPTIFDGYEWPPYDMVETHREIESIGIWNISTTWKSRVCRANCDDNGEVTSPYTDPINIPDWGSNSYPGTISVGGDEVPECPCYQTSAMKKDDLGDQTQNIYDPFNTDPLRIPFRYEWYVAYNAYLHYSRSENQSVESAAIKAQVSAAFGAGFTFTIEVRDADNTLIYNEDFIIDPLEVNPSQTELTCSVINLDLSQNLALLTADPSSTTMDDRVLSIHIYPTSSSSTYGNVYFSRIWLEMDGTFVNLDDDASKDFTVGFVHKDGTDQCSAMYAKIDDRSSTNDADLYPTGSIIKSRHSKALAKFTTDGWLKELSVNYNSNATSIFDYNLGGLSVSTYEYDGDGHVVSSVDPRCHEVSTTYDARGRVTNSTNGSEQFDWTDINAENPLLGAYDVSESEASYAVGLPQDFSIPALQASTYGGFCERITNSVVTISTPLETTHNATFKDALGRVRGRVQNYVESTFASDMVNPQDAELNARNLATWYSYDVLGRVISVTNPKGQQMSYTYDEHGRVASTYQVDEETTTFRYDKLGHLRFSQTADQFEKRRVTYRQYDDVGRPTVVGEAELLPIPGSPLPEPPLPTLLDPEILHTGVDALLTANQTLLLPPVRLVPSIYHVGINLEDPPPGSPQNLVEKMPMCPQAVSASLSSRFNPASPPGNLTQVLSHAANHYMRPIVVAPDNVFENAADFPEFTLQAMWYDDMPPQAGSVWGAMPPATVWNAMAPYGSVRNLKGRMAAVAYRTHGGEPFHFIINSYDERGRVEAQLRFTENLGFDAVYYTYNSRNLLTSVRTIDVTGQNATWYGYDGSGRPTRSWSARSQDGFNQSMAPVLPQLLTMPTGALDVTVQYDVADAPAVITYPDAGLTTTHSYNGMGMLMKSVTESITSVAPLLEQRLSYRLDGAIKEQHVASAGAWKHDTYDYDHANRLVFWYLSTGNNIPLSYESYSYDAVGNRTQLRDPSTGLQLAGYTCAGGSNKLINVTYPAGGDLISYDPDGAMVYRKRDGVEGGLAFQRIEEYAWNAFNLLEQFTVRTDAVAEGGGPGCEPDATTMPADVWRYRFNPMQEREQKRQEITSGNVARDGLAWTYTLLGADTKQLATYNGIEGAFCGQPSVWLWPVEYNSYGPANTRVILRPNGTKEYVIADHLGSPRITVNDQGAILQHTTYTPFGSVLSSTGSGQRTGYIGREADNETGLGNYGVRLYEPEYGRFMSVDVLWGEYEGWQAYQYGANTPVNVKDANGLHITFVGTDQEVAWAKELYTQAMYRYYDKGAYPAFCIMADALTNPNYSFNLMLTKDSYGGIDIDGDGCFDLPPTGFIPIGYRSQTNFSVPLRNTLFWDPYLAVIGDNVALSPFDVLLHEVSHAWLYHRSPDHDQFYSLKYDDVYGYLNDTRYESYGWGDGVERWTILGIESVTAKILGEFYNDDYEYSRSNHSGEPVRVSSPDKVPN